ncbi:SDR family oxidoreductase [Shouchella clausii]|uniref:SDR family NAD(P)-dependent oxidoreductase n=1 Tax=Shouchella clausii TaxID=79880 RepID=UPI003981DCF1
MRKKRVVVITGGTRGIGASTAYKFAQEGDRIVLAGRSEEDGQAVVQTIKSNGGEAIFVRTDVSKYEDVEALVEAAVETYGSIDVMFNNAGYASVIPSLASMSLEEYQKTINVNQHGVAYGILAAGKKMIELNKRGIIINNSSVFGYLASFGGFAYHASKGAINMMTKSAALEYTPHGIRVVAVAPGFVDTDILQEFRDMGIIDQLKAKNMGNKLIEPKQIADAVYMISLDEASAINGSVVKLDDGYASFK